LRKSDCSYRISIDESQIIKRSPLSIFRFVWNIFQTVNQPIHNCRVHKSGWRVSGTLEGTNERIALISARSVERVTGFWNEPNLRCALSRRDNDPCSLAILRGGGLTVDDTHHEKQHGNLQGTDDDQQHCICDEFPLYGYFLIGLAFCGLEYLAILLLNLGFLFPCRRTVSGPFAFEAGMSEEERKCHGS
jgi:hypothetical protein